MKTLLFKLLPAAARRYRHLTSLLAVTLLLFLLLPVLQAIFCLALWQLSQIAMSKSYRRGYVCVAPALTEEQVREFEGILNSFKGFGTLFKDLDAINKAEGGFAAIKALPDLFKKHGEDVDAMKKEIGKLRKQSIRQVDSSVRWVGGKPFISTEAAKALAADVILQANDVPGMLPKLINEESRRVKYLAEARAFAGIEQKAGGALTSGDIPLPTIYMPQVIELVFAYGQGRQYATVFPLGAGTVKLPRLLAGEDAFGFLGAGTAGMSQQIAQKEVEAILVTFTANKMGGLIRIPTELEEDTFIALGQFLARYIARQFAKTEDSTIFLGDGSGTYANITGVGPYCANNPAYLFKPAAGNTLITDLTINNFRAMRALVNPAILANMAANGQTSAAYYMHPSMEAVLVTFNTIGQPLIYVPASNGKPATLDGWPIRWIGVSAANNGNAQPNAYVAFFGDLSYWYLGERGAPRVEVSREVFFATDELAMRALERIDVEAMAIDAMSALQLPAA